MAQTQNNSSFARNGFALTIADLPPPAGQRWSASQKRLVVKAVHAGLLSFDEAGRRYSLLSEEYAGWQKLAGASPTNDGLRPPPRALSRTTRTISRFAAIVLGTIATWAPTPSAAATLAVDKALILAEHNRYRAELGVPPLVWSDRLAQGAQQWVDQMAMLNRLQRSATPRIGENIAMWRGANSSLTLMISNWALEKTLFQLGRFPNVSRDGSWHSVGHYTQIVWQNTTEVGCGTSKNGATDFLVCWYDPPGNIAGQVPYSPALPPQQGGNAK